MHTTCVLVWLAVWVLFFVHEVIIVTQVVVPLALQPFYFFYHSHISVFCGYINLNLFFLNVPFFHLNKEIGNKSGKLFVFLNLLYKFIAREDHVEFDT